MNEQIKQIAEQAGLELDDDAALEPPPPIYYITEKDLEKFTELLIKECSKVIQNWKKEPFPFDEDLAVQLIHEHFGFEVPPKNIKVIKI